MKMLFLVWMMVLIALGCGVAQEMDHTPLNVGGTIGDAADDARMYEINGTIYTFPPDLLIEDQYGKVLTFQALKLGVRVKVVGVKTKDVMVFEKVVVFDTEKNR